MDSDTNLDGEVDHSFFDSDCEGGRRSARPAPGAPPPSSSGRGPGAASASPGRPGSPASSASPPASRSSASGSPSSTSSSGKAASFPGGDRVKSSGPSTNFGDRAGSRDGGSGEMGSRPQSGPGGRSRSGEAAPSDPASDSDSDTNSSSSARSSSSSLGQRFPSFPTSQRRPSSSPKSRKGLSKGFCQGKNEDQDSEGTVTDVTPLSSPDSSPIHSVHQCKESKANSCRKKSSNKQENVSQAVYSSLDRLSFDRERGQGRQKSLRRGQPREARSSNVSSKSDSLESNRLDERLSQKILNDATDLNQLLKAMLHLEKRELRKIVADFPPQRYRKNYTFSNEETKRIDRENQRLLQELTRKATKPAVVAPKGISPATARIYHSTLNRQREQARIEKENLAFLKRLEAVKPTVGLTRSSQLLDYQRQMSFTESHSQRSRPTTSGSVSRISSRSSSHKNIHPVSNSSA